MPRADIKPLPSRAELIRLFAYDPITGALTWRVRPILQARRITPGMAAGTVRKGRCNYLAVGMSRKYYLAHRIIWKMMTGEEPSNQIDHRDGDKLNNRWTNLRPADNGQNIWNSKRRRDNKSGAKGVCWDTHHRAWRATIGVGKKQIRLGRFKNLADAIAARQTAQHKLHGEFSRAA